MKIFSVSLVQKQDRQKQNKQQKTPLLTDSDAAAAHFCPHHITAAVKYLVPVWLHHSGLDIVS